MIIRYQYYVLACLLSIPIFIHSLTFNISVQQRAQIDIAVYMHQPIMNDHVLLGNNNALVRCSLIVDPQERVLWWQDQHKQTMDPLEIERIIKPEDHVKAPQLHRSPISVILDPETIQDLAGEDMSQVYVRVKQRTYDFDPSLINNIRFFHFSLLMSEFVGVNDTVTVQASGLIDPSKFHKVPPSFQERYPEATGSAS